LETVWGGWPKESIAGSYRIIDQNRVVLKYSGSGEEVVYKFSIFGDVLVIQGYLPAVNENAWELRKSLTNEGEESSENVVKVAPIKAKDINGNEVDFNKLKNYKLIIIGINPNCGGCITSVKRVATEIEKYDISNTKFLVFSFSDTLEDAHKIGDQLPEGTIIIFTGSRANQQEKHYQI